MEFVFAGGAREVGGSCIYVRLKEMGILMDAGIHQSGSKDPLPDFQAVQQAGDVDAIIVSHAHMDHTGSLPVISKAYPGARIYMTPMTMDLTRILLADSLKLMNRAEGSVPLYSQDDVDAMMARVVPVPFETPYQIKEGITFTFYPAGHIAGAACIYLLTPEGSIFYSGDVSGFAQETIEGIRIPRLRPDVGLFESTYGNRLHANRQGEEQKLIDTVSEAVQQGKKVLIPSFALGRSQEVLLILSKAMAKKQIPMVPVYVDGMVRDMTMAYLRYPTYLRAVLARKIMKGQNPFFHDAIQPVSNAMDRKELVHQKGLAIFVASSGMLTGGPSVTYAKELVPDENAVIIITGYQDEEAPGRTLLNMMDADQEEKDAVIDGTLLPVKCKVVQVGLSAHSDKSELLALMERLGCHQIVLVHGDEDAMSVLGTELSGNLANHVYQPSTGTSLSFSFHHQRKQLPQQLSNTMHGTDIADPQQQKALYAFWQQNYPYRTFTMQDLYAMYTGRTIHADRCDAQEEEQLQQFANIIENSVYFSRDARRMFLFRRNNEAEIAEQTKKKEPAMQDVQAELSELLKEIPYRKLGFYQDEKMVKIICDYPDAFDKTVLQNVDEKIFHDTGWHVSLHEAMNHQAADILLHNLFAGNVKKISYYEEKKEYVISLLDESKADPSFSELFTKTTGWKLSFGIPSGSAVSVPESSAVQDEMMILSHGGNPLEQNAAMTLIHAMFAGEDVKPYKLGIKTVSGVRCFEAAFLSPQLGLGKKELLQRCADDTGWNMHIAASVNQNAIQILLAQLCAQYGISLSKNPSYLAGEKTMEIRTVQEIPEEMKDRFHKETGLYLRKKI
ncbi:MBL fold metallo-hydrolase [Lactimicrobium massiliense]|uniref:MBL fold metallo-hydrolase n=1 Tax=Lactimicrobium massiliense TaxID=2161814 RepID=UPI001435598C|nr:MBL fold metallo-hydrolase [Lactimicrobium massiliense]